MGAVYELWWVIIMFGGPALIAVLWERHKKNQARKNEFRVVQWDQFQRVFQEGLTTGYYNQIDKQRQKRKDDQIFNTVEEYRDELD